MWNLIKEHMKDPVFLLVMVVSTMTGLLINAVIRSYLGQRP